jgi:chlorite dismutase
MTDKNTALIPEEGWHCLHLFYRIEHGQWQLLSRDEQNAAKTNLSSLVQEVRSIDSTQLLTLGMVTPKADLGFMLITPDLHNANRIEKRLSLSLGADVLTPVYSYLSLTEESEYITSEEEYAQTLEPSVRNDSAKLAEALNSFRERIKHYRQERVYPMLPDWPIVCFYNMSKRRAEQRNWYALPFDERRKLMKGHRMGSDTVCTRYVSDQSDRLQNAFRSGERRVRGFRRILYRYPITARRIVPPLPTLTSARKAVRKRPALQSTSCEMLKRRRSVSRSFRSATAPSRRFCYYR